MGGSLVKAAVLDFGIQWSCWAVAAALQTEKFYDLAGSSTFAILTLLSLNQNATFHRRQIVNSGIVVTWASRLGVYLFSRILKEGSDKRFDNIRSNPRQFLVYWTVQGVWIYCTLLPTLIVNTKKDNSKLVMRDYLGWSLSGLGLLLETVADFQKSQFRSNPDNAGKFISSGLWSISRHPNYLGEIFVWLGLYISASSTLRGWEHVSIISPMTVTYLLTRVSGIPLLESAAQKKWGADPDYQEYVRNTAVLVPFIW